MMGIGFNVKSFADDCIDNCIFDLLGRSNFDLFHLGG